MLLQVNYDGWSAVLMAANHGMGRVLHQLLSAGARHDLTRDHGETSLHLAALRVRITWRLDRTALVQLIVF